MIQLVTSISEEGVSYDVLDGDVGAVALRVVWSRTVRFVGRSTANDRFACFEAAREQLRQARQLAELNGQLALLERIGRGL